MTILITGAYGFIGSSLSNTLKAKHTLWALDISEKQNTAYSHYYCWDDLELLPWEKVDIIIHLAGKVHDTKNQSNARIYFEVNTGLTKKVFDKFLHSSAKQFIFFSTVKAAADTVEGEILTENVTPRPQGPYGESKRLAEEYIQQKIESDTNAQLKKVYILRPCMIHGPGNKGNLHLLYNIVSKGIPWPLGAFENKRSFLSIENLSFIIEQFMLQGPESGIYHIADDEPVSTNELIQLIAQSKEKKARIWNCNKDFIKTIARIGAICKLPLNSDRLQKLTENYVVSNQKMKQTLGIITLPVSAVEGLKRTLEAFK